MRTTKASLWWPDSNQTASGKPGAVQSEQAALLAVIFKTPDPARDGTCSWTLSDLCDWTEARFGKRLSTSGMWGVLKRLDLSHQKARPVHPKTDPKAQLDFQKKGS